MNAPSISFAQQVERAAGLDIHKVEIVATISGVGIETETRDFKSTTSSLTELKDWLLEKGITHVAMESTGVYWKPVCNILESGGFTILVVNARHIKYVPGHKTDKKDSTRICKLLRAGLLKGSFIPGVEQRNLRDLTRYRRKLVQQQSSETNRMIRIFEDANLKLSGVFSNVHGKTCSTIIEAVLAGNTDADYLSSLCTHRNLKCTREEIRDAVEGRFTEHHKFMLGVIRDNIEHLETKINEPDKRIDELVFPIAEIPEMGETGAKELSAEIGVDMEVFPTEGHLSSWAGVCPGNNESADKKSSKTNHGNKATKSIVTECAWAASGTKGTHLQAKYQKLAGRRGKKRAVVAVGHAILRIVCHILKDGTTYKEPGGDYVDSRQKESQIKYHQNALIKLGVDVPGKLNAG